MATSESKIPRPAKYSVRCDSSDTGKHKPATRESTVGKQHIKYKICTECNLTLK